MATMLPRSYASDTATTGQDAWQWLLFTQQRRADAFTLTVVAYSGNNNNNSSSSVEGDEQETRTVADGKRALYELQLDEQRLCTHTEELGIEVDVDAFVELFRSLRICDLLLQKTLESRACVDVVVNQKEDQAPGQVSLLLTYKFSETISRKGCFELPLVAADIPEQVVNLLTGLHATPNVLVLTISEKHQREAIAIAAANASTSSSTTNSTASISASAFSFTSAGGALSQDQGESSQSNGSPETTTSATTNPQVLKRRHVPSGTMYVQH